MGESTGESSALARGGDHYLENRKLLKIVRKQRLQPSMGLPEIESNERNSRRERLLDVSRRPTELKRLNDGRTGGARENDRARRQPRPRGMERF